MVKTALLTLAFFSLLSNKINEKVIICGLTKNNATTLYPTLKTITRIGSIFNDYRVIILENNSIDNTKKILKNFQISSKKHTVFSRDYTKNQLLSFSKSRTWDNQPARVELIATFRNIILDKIFDEKYNDFKFIIIIDLDLMIPNTIYKNLIETFKIKDNWDAIFANAVGENQDYYDRFALRTDDFPIGPELDPNWWDNLSPISFKGDKLIKVYSAFGGLGIYKKEALKGCSYSGVADEYVEKFTKQLFLKEHVQNNPAVLRYKNYIKSLRRDKSICNLLMKKPNCKDHNTNNYKAAIMTNEFDPLSFLINCCGHKHYPILCEHTSLHYQMILKGYDRLYINPKLYIFYP